MQKESPRQRHKLNSKGGGLLGSVLSKLGVGICEDPKAIVSAFQQLQRWHHHITRTRKVHTQPAALQHKHESTTPEHHTAALTPEHYSTPPHHSTNTRALHHSTNTTALHQSTNTRHETAKPIQCSRYPAALSQPRDFHGGLCTWRSEHRATETPAKRQGFWNRAWVEVQDENKQRIKTRLT